MPDAMSEDELSTLTDDMCLGGAGHSFAAFTKQREYVIVKEVYVRSANDFNGKKQVSVNLDLRRLSDGLESKFMDIVSEDKLRKFIDGAKKDETMAFFKGKVLNAFYYNEEPIMVTINKYAL